MRKWLCTLSVGATLNLERVGRFIAAVGQYEDKIFQARMRKMRADKNRYLQQKANRTSDWGQNSTSGNWDGNSGSAMASQQQRNDRAQLNSNDPKQFLAGRAPDTSTVSPGMCCPSKICYLTQVPLLPCYTCVQCLSPMLDAVELHLHVMLLASWACMQSRSRQYL